MGTYAYLVLFIFSNVMAVSWFNIIYFSNPPWNLTNNLFFTTAYNTNPVNSFFIRLVNPYLIYPPNSPNFDFTTNPTMILLPPLPWYLLCLGGGARIRIKNSWFHSELNIFICWRGDIKLDLCHWHVAISGWLDEFMSILVGTVVVRLTLSATGSGFRLVIDSRFL